MAEFQYSRCPTADKLPITIAGGAINMAYIHKTSLKFWRNVILIKLAGSLGNGKGFENTVFYLIDSGQSGIYVRCRYLDGCPQYDEALKVPNGDFIAALTVTRIRVTVPNATLTLGVNFFTDSVERFIVYIFTRGMTLFSVWLGMNAISHG